MLGFGFWLAAGWGGGLSYVLGRAFWPAFFWGCVNGGSGGCVPQLRTWKGVGPYQVTRNIGGTPEEHRRNKGVGSLLEAGNHGLSGLRDGTDFFGGWQGIRGICAFRFIRDSGGMGLVLKGWPVGVRGNISGR